MFERYTDRSRRVIVLAQEQARVLRHPAVDVGHLLLGLAVEGEALAAQALARLGADEEAVRAAVTRERPPGTDPVPGHLPFTREARWAAEGALKESLTLGHPYIGTEHLLLGVTAGAEARPGEPGARLLGELGVTPAQVREAVMILLNGEPADKAAEGDPLALVLARLDGIARDVGAIRKHLGVAK